jgi:hypothetical protein
MIRLGLPSGPESISRSPAGAFGQSVTLVFCGKGLALLSNKPQTNGDLFRLLGSLPYYEIEQVHTLSLPPGSEAAAGRPDDIANDR